MSLPSVTGLDHYIIRVNDLQAATDRYVKLGFSLAPQGQHHRGTRNQTIILDANYLELLTFPEEPKAQSRFGGFDDASVIGVRELASTRALFDANLVTYRANARGELVVAPDDAGDALQVFVQEACREPTPARLLGLLCERLFVRAGGFRRRRGRARRRAVPL